MGLTEKPDGGDATPAPAEPPQASEEEEAIRLLHDDMLTMDDERSNVESMLKCLPCRCTKCTACQIEVPDISYDAASRFLKACEGDMLKAAHKLTASLIWRFTYGVDRLLEEPQEISDGRSRAMEPVFPMGVHCRPSRHGHPIYILRAGHSVPAAGRTADLFGGESGEEVWIKHHVWCSERCLAVNPMKLVIWDLANLSSTQLGDTDTMSLLRRLINIDLRNYPLTIHRILVVNSPALLQTVWPAICAMLDLHTLSLLQLLGDVSDPEVQAALMEEIALEDLPGFLGGGYVGPLPLGLELPKPAEPVSWYDYFFCARSPGPYLPEEEYEDHESRDARAAERVEQVCIMLAPTPCITADRPFEFHRGAHLCCNGRAHRIMSNACSRRQISWPVSTTRGSDLSLRG